MISLRVDGELSELGERRLDEHLLECADCRAYAGSVTLTTAQLRSAPLERPRLPLAVPSRSSRARSARLGGVAAVGVAAVAAAALVTAPLGGRSGPTGPPVRVTASSNADVVDQRLTRMGSLLALLQHGGPPRGPQEI